jgi:hypothetical protein
MVARHSSKRNRPAAWFPLQPYPGVNALGRTDVSAGNPGIDGRSPGLWADEPRVLPVQASISTRREQ